jgi:hypothetical protein
MKWGIARASLWVALCLGAGLAHGHDSWLSPSRHDAPAGEVALELATGSRYPLAEVAPAPASVLRPSCVDTAGRAVGLTPSRVQDQWLELAASRAQAPGACWLALAEAEIVIEPALVKVYLAEIQASPAIRETWQSLQARQLPWRERYRKFARIELPPASDLSPVQWRALRQPVGLGLEIVVLGDQPIAVGQGLAFQVLRDGRPLAGLPVELVSERSPLGIWQRTDAQGVLRHALPFPGRWLLRGVDLRTSAADPTVWESRFTTLAIESR